MPREDFGFLNIDKPPGLTSHDVVVRIRRKTGLKRVGHAGTLDPLARGVLVVCLGGATRLSEYVMASTKRYRAVIQLGAVTSTYDAEGEIIRQTDPSSVSRDQVAACLTTFIGSIDQVPPMYSAVKRGGHKLYELARQGVTLELEGRSVRIDALELTDWNPPHFTLDVVCSAGTYIRSLAYDIGEALGVGAHLAALTRTASGVFNLTDSVTLDSFMESPTWESHLIDPMKALSGWPMLYLQAADCLALQQGRPVVTTEQMVDAVLCLGIAPDGNLIAVLKRKDGQWWPHKVFLTGSEQGT
ncbi:MAG: tRNA pseudouridine(55) synthase TruB [Anaerolineae bacterium]|nr:tRNA pseudouridine(55) synthase TruB [Anaerolineae bacterium]